MSESITSKISIGILTSGYPHLSGIDAYTELKNNDGSIDFIPTCESQTATLENILIGHSFHWQKSATAFLPGILRLLDPASNSRTDISLINIIDTETYLESVVGSEMNPNAPEAFLEAHAIVARSWAYGKILHSHPESTEGMSINPTLTLKWEDTHSHNGFDVCSDDHCQRYQGLRPISEVAHRAIANTKGLILLDSQDRIADCRFSKCCGGTTELFSTCWQNRDFDYLQSKPCPHCNPKSMSRRKKELLFEKCLTPTDALSSDFHSWQHFVSKNLIIGNLASQYGIQADEIVKLEPMLRGPSGRICLLRVYYMRNGRQLHHDFGKELTIRRLLSDSHLYSSAFNISSVDQGYILNGKGWGHGVGMCQIGAASMALDGFSCSDILSFYFPNTHISKL